MNRLKRELAARLKCRPDIVAMTAYPERGLVAGQDSEELARELASIIREVAQQRFQNKASRDIS